MISNSRFRYLGVLLITVITILINTLANILPINGQNTGEISDRFNILFVPAGYVFSIWGLIYIGLIGFAIYQSLASVRNKHIIQAITPAYWLAGIANSAWIFLWHYELFTLTLVAMLTLLISLISIYRHLSAVRKNMDRRERLFLFAPFSIYLAWISVATIANVSQVLDYLGWNAWGISEIVWAATMLIIATALGLTFLYKEGDLKFPSVLVWAFIGIGVQQAEIAWLPNLAFGLAASLAILVVFQALRLSNQAAT